MNSRRRGLMLIINNKQYDNITEPKLSYREGSDKDAENLMDLFLDLHFHVRKEVNQTAKVW